MPGQASSPTVINTPGKTQTGGFILSHKHTHRDSFCCPLIHAQEFHVLLLLQGARNTRRDTSRKPREAQGPFQSLWCRTHSLGAGFLASSPHGWCNGALSFAEMAMGLGEPFVVNIFGPLSPPFHPNYDSLSDALVQTHVCTECS